MKLSYLPIRPLTIFVLIVLNLFLKIECSHSKTEVNLQNHLSMMMQFKVQTRSLLNNLFITANSHTTEIKKNEKNENLNQNEILRTKFKVSKNQRRTILRSKTLVHSSTIKNRMAAREYPQYRYKSFSEIVTKLDELSKKFPDYLRINTAQNLYGLPNPGGYCGPNKQK